MIYTHKYESKLLGNILLAADLESEHEEKFTPVLKESALWLIVPCHRVIGADGSLTGYTGGLDKKQKLLELEKYA